MYIYKLYLNILYSMTYEIKKSNIYKAWTYSNNPFINIYSLKNNTMKCSNKLNKFIM